ncbi:MAG: FKBP-type peptidyl-prolyl cis-trans isomerase N-terminal domain-containing protein [Pseudomonadota bacterium]
MSVTAVPLRPIQKGTLAKLWIGIFALIAAALAFAWFTATPSAAQSPQAFLAWNGARADVVTTDSGLQYEVLEAGEEGAESPGPEDAAVVNYTLRLLDGEVVDEGQGQPFPLSQVFPGFGEGVQEMTIGARHMLWLRPELWLPPGVAPGDPPAPQMPFETTDILEFEVELIDVLSQEEFMQQMMQQQQLQQQLQEQMGEQLPPQ